MFQIRLHGRGGQGVVTSAEMLCSPPLPKAITLKLSQVSAVNVPEHRLSLSPGQRQTDSSS